MYIVSIESLLLQVFILLESVYAGELDRSPRYILSLLTTHITLGPLLAAAFDEIAHRRKVFKVETVCSKCLDRVLVAVASC